MVTEEIKTLFRKANRQVDKKIWAGKAEGTTRRAQETDTKLGGAGRAQIAPPGLSLWLKADLFKRIVRRLANLPAASAAEHGGANVMRVVAQPADKHGEAASPLVHSSEPSLTTEWSPIIKASRGSPIRRSSAPKRHISKWNVDFPVVFFSCGCYIAMAEYFMILALQICKLLLYRIIRKDLFVPMTQMYMAGVGGVYIQMFWPYFQWRDNRKS